MCKQFIFFAMFSLLISLALCSSQENSNSFSLLRTAFDVPRGNLSSERLGRYLLASLCRPACCLVRKEKVPTFAAQKR